MRAYRIAIVVALCLFAHVSRADSQQLTILSARDDNGTLVVSGGFFASGIRVFVALTQLTVTSVTPTEVRATLPALNSGSYLLTLFQPATVRIGTFPYAHSASQSAPVVVDGQGSVVGTLLDPTTIIRSINGVRVLLFVSPSGFTVSPGNVKVFYKTADCTGTPYLQIGIAARMGFTFAGTIYYPGEPLENFMWAAKRELDSTNCDPAANPQPADWFGPLVTVPVPALTPPFVVP